MKNIADQSFADQSTAAVWTNGYDTALANVIHMICREFPKPTLGIQKVVRLIEEMTKDEL